MMSGNKLFHLILMALYLVRYYCYHNFIDENKGIEMKTKTKTSQ